MAFLFLQALWIVSVGEDGGILEKKEKKFLFLVPPPPKKKEEETFFFLFMVCATRIWDGGGDQIVQGKGGVGNRVRNNYRNFLDLHTKKTC